MSGIENWMVEAIRKIRTELLQTRLEGNLKDPSTVLSIVRKYDQPYGLDNTAWEDICGFILEIEPASNPDIAKNIADKYNLQLTIS